MKTCAKCNKSKELTEFHRYHTRKDGRFPYCKDCNNAIRSKSGYVYVNRKAYYEVEENKLKEKTRQNTRIALKKGIIKRQTSCQVCGTTKNIQCHHLDYSDPLKVEWLCPSHHYDADKNLRSPNTQ